MAVQTFRHVAMLFPSGHRLLDRLLAMSAMLYDIALEERIQAWLKSGRSISPYDPFGSQTTVRKQDPGWEGIAVQEARSAQVRLDRAMLAFLSRVPPISALTAQPLHAQTSEVFSRQCVANLDRPPWRPARQARTDAIKTSRETRPQNGCFEATPASSASVRCGQWTENRSRKRKTRRTDRKSQQVPQQAAPYTWTAMRGGKRRENTHNVLCVAARKTILWRTLLGPSLPEHPGRLAHSACRTRPR